MLKGKSPSRRSAVLLLREPISENNFVVTYHYSRILKRKHHCALSHNFLPSFISIVKVTCVNRKENFARLQTRQLIKTNQYFAQEFMAWSMLRVLSRSFITETSESAKKRYFSRVLQSFHLVILVRMLVPEYLINIICFLF